MKKNVTSRPDASAGLTDSPDAYLTKQQLARHLNVSTRTIDAMMKRKLIGYLKITRKLVRFRKSDVDDYLAQNFRVNAVGE